MRAYDAVEILLERIRKDYPDDVALLVVMGSSLYGDTHSRSDIDLYFVTKTPRGERLAFTFIVDGIGFDFWSIPWRRLEDMADHKEDKTAIITEGRVLWHGSDEDLARFEALKRHALDTGDRFAFACKAEERFATACRWHIDLLSARTLSESRSAAIGTIYALGHVLALLNGTTIKRGRKRLRAEILAMEWVPVDFGLLYDAAFTGVTPEEIATAFTELMKNTRMLILEQKERTRPARDFVAANTGLYEEMINAYNKIHHACDTGDPVTPLFAAVELTREYEDVWAGTGRSVRELPDLVAAYDPHDPEGFRKVAVEHQSRLEGILREETVPIRVLQDLDELEEFLGSL